MSRYLYSCLKCGGPVTKTATSGTTGLGGWRCAVDGAGIKVKRVMNKEKKSV